MILFIAGMLALVGIVLIAISPAVGADDGVGSGCLFAGFGLILYTLSGLGIWIGL